MVDQKLGRCPEFWIPLELSNPGPMSGWGLDDDCDDDNDGGSGGDNDGADDSWVIWFTWLL